MTTPQVAIATKSFAAAARNATTVPGKVKVKLDGKQVELARGRILDSLRKYGLSSIPAVCYHPDVVDSGGRCRACSCSVNGRIIPICDIEVKEGMNIVTNTPELLQLRDAALELVPHDDITTQSIEEATTPDGAVEFFADNQSQQQQHQASTSPSSLSKEDTIPLKKVSKYILRHPEKCTHCGLCVSMCQQTQGIGAIADVRLPLGEGSVVEAFHNKNLADSECISCGQCITVCPTGALEEMSEIDEVEFAFNDPSSIKIVQFAPAVRLALAEEFNYAPGERSLTKEMVEACRLLADRRNTFVFDTNFTADLTIIEECYELLERLRRVLTGQKKFGSDDMNTDLPMITSCSPGWVLFCEKNYHDLIPNLSSCKSPQQMFGALAKHYFAPKLMAVKNNNNGEPADTSSGSPPNKVQDTSTTKRKVVSISVMPCVAKKAEKERPEFATNGEFDVDHVITTREFAKMLRKKGIDPTRLVGENFDQPFGLGSGAGVIFGATGGVMEAAIRTAYEVVTGRPVPFRRLDITEVRGMQGVKEASLKIENVLDEWKFLEGVELKVAVAHGTANARKLMDRIRAAKEQNLSPPYHFVEVMACPGGCLGGGGNPLPQTMETKMKRAQLIYEQDKGLPVRKSHENPAIKELYKSFLKEPLGHLSHELLHTKYTPREAEASSLISTPEAKEIRTNILYKNNYPINTRHGLTNILVDIVDEYGYISDPAVAAVANHVGMTPVALDSIISHYHFLPREKPTSKSTLWLCDCLTCRSKGAREIKHHIRERESSEEEQQRMEVHMVQWLGFCVSGSPAALIQRAGDKQLHALYNLTINDARLASNSTLDSIDSPQQGDLRFRQLPISRMPCDSSSASSNKMTKTTTTPIPIPNAQRPSILENISLLPEDVEWYRKHGSAKNAGNGNETTSTAAVIKCPVSRKINAMSPDEIIEQIKISGLRGCGGAGFPTFLKWRSVRDADPTIDRYVVVNADEGLPSTFKDYAILADPSRRMRMIIGMCTCARVTKAKRCMMYLRYEYKNLKPLIEASFQKYATELNPLVDAEGIRFEIILGAGPYVCGEETALFESVEGHAPQARCHREKYATEKGLHNLPTCVNNVETFAWIPAILYNNGAQRFADCGRITTRHEGKPTMNNNNTTTTTTKNHGVKLFCVSGQVAQPTLAEFPLGTTLREIIEDCAPEIPIGPYEGDDSSLCGDLAAVEVGGVVERLIMGSQLVEALDQPLSLTGEDGTLPGGGSIVLFRRSHKFNAQQFYQAKAKFAHKESCNLCAPCRDGTKLFRSQITKMITNPRAIWDKEKVQMAKLYHAMETLSNCGHGKACGKMARLIMEDTVGRVDFDSHEIHAPKKKLWKHPKRVDSQSYTDRNKIAQQEKEEGGTENEEAEGKSTEKKKIF